MTTPLRPSNVILLWFPKGEIPVVTNFETLEDLSPPSPNPEPHHYIEDAIKHGNMYDVRGLNKEPWILVRTEDDQSEILSPKVIKSRWWRKSDAS